MPRSEIPARVRKLHRNHAAERDIRPRLYALHYRKNLEEQNERNEEERKVEFHFTGTNMVAYLHYLFPGAASITASRQAAVTQTRIATAAACSPLGSIPSNKEPRGVYRPSLSMRLFLFSRIIRVWNRLFSFLFFSLSFSLSLSLSLSLSALSSWSSINGPRAGSNTLRPNPPSGV